MQKIYEAVKILKNGGVIIFPTETVYGIGALASNENAIKKIYEIKGRSFDKPLQILISDISQVDLFASEISDKAKELMKKYWPGPLTLVFKTASGSTVGLRMPDSPIILELIRQTGPIAASSANISGQPDPTCIGDVKIEADLLLDGGPCKMGKPSTVVDVSVDPPTILRQGAIEIY